MTGTNPPTSVGGAGGPPSAAAIARGAGPGQGTQALKQSTQAAFEGDINFSMQ